MSSDFRYLESTMALPSSISSHSTQSNVHHLAQIRPTVTQLRIVKLILGPGSCHVLLVFLYMAVLVVRFHHVFTASSDAVTRSKQESVCHCHIVMSRFYHLLLASPGMFRPCVDCLLLFAHRARAPTMLCDCLYTVLHRSPLPFLPHLTFLQRVLQCHLQKIDTSLSDGKGFCNNTM